MFSIKKLKILIVLIILVIIGVVYLTWLGAMMPICPAAAWQILKNFFVMGLLTFIYIII